MKKTYEKTAPIMPRRIARPPSDRSRVLTTILKDASYCPEEYLRCLKAGYGGE